MLLNARQALGHGADPDSGSLEVRGTDLEREVIVTVPAVVEKVGQVAVDGQRLHALVKEVSEDTIEFTGGTDPVSLTVKAGRSRWRLLCLAADEFPSVPVDRETEAVRVKGALLLAAIQNTEYAVSESQDRYAMMGLHVRFGQDQAVLAATDGHRMVRRVLPLEAGLHTERAVLIPDAALRTISTLLRKADEATLLVGESSLGVVADRIRYSTRLLEGLFPDVEQVIERTKDHPLQAEVDAKALATAIRQAVVMSDGRAHAVRLTFGAKGVTVQARSTEGGEADVTIPAKWNGEELAVGLNGRYLLDWLGAVGGQSATLALRDATSAIACQAPGAPQYVLMPLRG